MTAQNRPTTPQRGAAHDALAIFLGHWRAEGRAYGGTDQSGPDPRAHGVPWRSEHDGRWHTGRFFLLQDERAMVDGAPFDTLGFLGVDPDTGRYVLRSIENHGYYRHYDVEVDGHQWSINGESERATIIFSEGNRRQDIVWQWKVDGRWLPLCDRVAWRQD